MSLPIEKQNILNALARIQHPGLKKNIVDLNFIKGLTFTDQKIGFILDYPSDNPQLSPLLKQLCETELKKDFPHHQIQIATPKQTPKTEPSFPPLQVKNIIAISSAKGGVGKSTTTVNLAFALQKQGYKVGILDADIYGPSIPLLLNIHDKPQSDGKMMVPLENHGIKAMSIGFLLPKDGAAIWRGPMVSSAITQMTYQVSWGELDYLLIDMPPGTGDIHLTLVQKLNLTGAIIVSTPQEIATQDTRKGIEMFKKTNIPILGLIENMSYFICDNCDKKHYIFDQGGMRLMAEKLNLPFLGEIPFNSSIRLADDQGLTQMNDYIAQAYADIAQKGFSKPNKTTQR